MHKFKSLLFLKQAMFCWSVKRNLDKSIGNPFGTRIINISHITTQPAHEVKEHKVNGTNSSVILPVAKHKYYDS